MPIIPKAHSQPVTFHTAYRGHTPHARHQVPQIRPQLRFRHEQIEPVEERQAKFVGATKQPAEEDGRDDGLELVRLSGDDAS